MPASLPANRRIFWTVAVVCALSRFAAMARSLWDWDEALFLLAMGDYDVTSHHPHPPGFPVYIAMAKIVRLVVASDFRALQSLNLVAGMLAFPALYFYARELGVKFQTAVIAGALFAFFPNVWFFGGTAFSDVLSIVLVLFAVVLLFRGRESRVAYFAGTILLALAIGIRPQNFLVGLFPGILATLRRPWRDGVIAFLLGAIIVGTAFGSAIYATGELDQYMRVVREHSDYIARIDSFRNPDRPPLWRIFDRFFFKQYQSAGLSILTSLFVLASWYGAVRHRDRTMLYNLLTFGPVAIAAWMMLDRYSISRFSIGYAPMFAVFAADGISRVARTESRQWAIGGVLAAAFAIWALPAFTDVRNELSPTVRAVEAAQREIDQTDETLFVGYSMVPFVEYLAPQLRFIRVIGVPGVPLTPAANPFLLAELQKGEPDGMIFRRQRGRLWNIARRHYFEVVLKPLRNIARFESGWHPPERDGMDEWRWMGASSVTILPPATDARELRLLFHVPEALIGSTVTVTFNGQVIDQIKVNAIEVGRDYEVTPAPAAAPNRLHLSTTRTVEHDGQQRGLRLRYLSWGKS